MKSLNFEYLSTEQLQILRISDHPEILRECLRLLPCEEDREELTAASGAWFLALYRSVGTENAHCCIYRGKVRALFGFNPNELPNALVPWLITDGVLRHELPVSFHRQCRRVLAHARSVGKVLVNCAMEDCMRYDWLEYLGFRIGPTRTWLRGKPFRRFLWRPEKEKKKYV